MLLGRSFPTLAPMRRLSESGRGTQVGDGLKVDSDVRNHT